MVCELKLSPSLAGAQLTNLERTVLILEKSGADMIHFDVEDGRFVPLMTLGTKLITDLRPISSLPFDVHLMVEEPEWLISDLLSCGVDYLSFHYEACRHPRRLLRMIREAGVKAGLSFNPKTEIPNLRYLEAYLDFVSLLTTEPEQKDPEFLAAVLQKVAQVRKMLSNQEIEIAVDGGITLGNVRTVVKSGATILVIGRAVFSGGDISSNLALFRQKCST